MSGRYEGLIIRHKGIKGRPRQDKAIIEFVSPRNIQELKGLQGCLTYIRGFISNLSSRCQPFSKLMKKDVIFVWDQQYQETLESIV